MAQRGGSPVNLYVPSAKLYNPHNDNVQKIIGMTKMFTDPVYRRL